MELLITLSSIVGITLLAFGFNAVFRAGRFGRKGVCPICVGVSLTWIWELVVLWQYGWGDSAIIAMLMGATVVGVTSQLERHLPNPSWVFLWKALFIPAGFITMYGIFERAWAVGVLGLVLGVAVYLAFFRRSQKAAEVSQTAADLEKKMEQCC